MKKNKKVAAAGVSLSEAYALSELGESGRKSVIHARAQRTIGSLSKSFISSRVQRAQLAKRKSTNSRLAGKWS